LARLPCSTLRKEQDTAAGPATLHGIRDEERGCHADAEPFGIDDVAFVRAEKLAFGE